MMNSFTPETTLPCTTVGYANSIKVCFRFAVGVGSATACVAEPLGAACLVATVVGSGIMAASLIRDVALALLGNTLATGAILVVLITILGPMSGAHFNPAVTLISR